MKDDITQSIKSLIEGNTILYPTDTVWGVGCDATNALAVNKVYTLKKRELSKSLIVLVSSIAMRNKYIEPIQDSVKHLIDTDPFSLTVIYPKGIDLAKNIPASDGSIAIRITKDKFCQLLINTLGKPIVSTSANLAGDDTPGNYHEITDEIKSLVDYIVGYKQNKIIETKPSKIVKVVGDKLITIRE